MKAERPSNSGLLLLIVTATIQLASGCTTSPALDPNSGSRGESLPTTHIVEPGDTLAGISTRYYGDTSHVKELLKANEAQLKDSPRLTTELEIIIPSLRMPDSSQ